MNAEKQNIEQKPLDNGVDTNSITKEDIANLNVIFALARRAVTDDEQQLTQIIQFRQVLVAKLLKLIKTNVINEAKK